MAGRYFGIPFATTGDRVTVPDATQPDGSVSFTQGFGFDYERPNTDPAYKPVPRDGTNGLFHDITEALGIAQRQGVSDWTVDAQPYPINALVRHTDKVWRSLVANNNVTPTEGASWTEVGALATKTRAGLIEIATNTETQTGTDAVRAVTPAGLASLKTSSPTDTTAGRLLKVGDFGIGEVNSAPLAVDLNSLPASGSYRIVPATLNRPFDYGTVFEQRLTTTEKTQIAISVTAEQVFFRKYQYVPGVWSAWREMYHTGNLAAAFGGANQGLTVNGYQKLPGGLIIQWGQAAVGTNFTPITYPIAYPNRTLVCWMNNNNNVNYTVASTFGTATGFSAKASAGSATNTWFSLGY